MKVFTLLAAKLLLVTTLMYGQTPEGLNYQAMLRGADDAPLANESVDIEVEITANAGPIFRESLTGQTNKFGILNIVIGENGSIPLDQINWGSGDVRIDLEVISSAGTVNLNNENFQNVPYALYAKTAENILNDQVDDADADPTNENQNLTYDNSSGELSISNGNSVTLPTTSGGDNWGSQTVASDNTLDGNGTSGSPLSVNGDLTDDQTLSLNGNDLSISNGNTVTISADDADADPANEFQFLTWDNAADELTISDGNTVDIDVDDADADPANEFQFLSFDNAANELTISDGNTVQLGSGGSGLWSQDLLGIYTDNDAYVGDDPNASDVLHLSGTAIDFHTSGDVQSTWAVDEFIMDGRDYDATMTDREIAIIGTNIDTDTETIMDINGFEYSSSGFVNGTSLMNAAGFYNTQGGAETSIGAAYIALNEPSRYAELTPENLRLGARNLGDYINISTVNNRGSVTVLNGGNFSAVNLTALTSGSGQISIMNASGTDKSTFGVLGSNAAWQAHDGNNGSINTLISTINGNANHGWVSVNDASGMQQAGLYVDNSGNGIVFADGSQGGVKSFVMPNPENANEEFWYACVEGPEVAAYDRGSAKLTDGTTEINFSDHFKQVIDHNTMTVILTPHSADTYGLAVVEKTETGFVVKELKNGQGDFGFDWEVKCKRRGWQDWKVIRPRREVGPALPNAMRY